MAISQFRALIDNMLEKAEYAAVHANSGREALVHLDQDVSYDLVLCDLPTAGSDGVNLANRIRLAHPETPLVMVTPGRDEASALAAVREGGF